MRSALAALALALLALALGGCGDSGGEASSTSTTTHEAGPRVAPLKVSGGGAAQFRVEGADNSIADYGSDASPAELRETAELVHGYFVALASEEWQRACSALSPEIAANVVKLAAGSPKFRGNGCPAALTVLFGKVSAAEGREASTVDAEALRREGSQGFLLYRGAKGKAYFMSVVRVGGGWAVAGLSPSGLG